MVDSIGEYIWSSSNNAHKPTLVDAGFDVGWSRKVI